MRGETAMLSERLSTLPGELLSFRPCPPARDRAGWAQLPSSARERLLAAGEAEAQNPLAPLPLSLWLDFIRTGQRAEWEAACFSRRSRLCALAAAECVEHQGRFLDEIASTVWAICEESAWQLPAHNSYVRDTPQLPLPDTARPLIDLFAAEAGALLATVHYLLGSELEAAYPGLATRMEREVRARILTPYLHDHFWWMGNGDEPMCNWTSWCTQNVLLCFFLLPNVSGEERQAAVRQAAYSLDCFLKDYGPDGCCNEGAQYYRHAGLTLWGALHILSAAAPETFATVFDEPKIKNIAEYILHVHVDGPYYLNFGDCSPLAGRCGAREYLFAKAVGSPALAALAAADFAADPDPDRLTAQDPSSRINLWYRLLTAFTEAELRSCPQPAFPTPDVWYPSVGVFAARRGGWVLGAKMGSNGDSHNHNDTGSVTVYKDGKPFLIDIGVESYTQKTFSPQRYEIWTMQSGWHNLPTFDGVMQLPGADYAARPAHPRPDQLPADGCRHGGGGHPERRDRLARRSGADPDDRAAAPALRGRPFAGRSGRHPSGHPGRGQRPAGAGQRPPPAHRLALYHLENQPLFLSPYTSDPVVTPGGKGDSYGNHQAQSPQPDRPHSDDLRRGRRGLAGLHRRLPARRPHRHGGRASRPVLRRPV